ncbi:LamG-like jellyroll fold domain-containing protein, partial [Tropicimonas marinistellae]|uniref:LamG-like jellyroll fold domain-containing protein n=1 Tax=Tropicimonas marinistellae TaxID=1739787 RepID=UPI000A575779
DAAKERGNIGKPAEPVGDGGTVLANGKKPVLAIPTVQEFDGMSQNALVFDHEDALALRNGTVAFRFKTGSELSYGALFSKDATDYGAGGHLTAYVESDGDLVVRFQTRDATHYLVASDILETKTSYEFAFSFGKEGAALYVDGVKVAYDEDLTQTLYRNSEALVVGASGTSNTPGKADKVNGAFTGKIDDFAIYSGQLEMKALYGNAKAEGTVSFDGEVGKYRFSTNDGGWLEVTGKGATKVIGNKARFLDFDDLTVRPDDVQVGTGEDETLYGTSASEIFSAGGGNDTVHGQDHDDYIFGGGGDDRLYAGDGRDIVKGGDGDDYIDGGANADVIAGGAGNDELKGNTGNDRLAGGLGDDSLFGNGWGDGGVKSERDRAIFDGDYADYHIVAESYYNSARGKDQQRLIVTDSYDGGADGYYEGRDLLYDIDFLVFDDRTVAVADIV